MSEVYRIIFPGDAGIGWCLYVMTGAP